ncbi:MAG TPA: GNAT family N-acetyltransferase [Mycobacteriales bacterium]|jgi:GNAT superfamily N-acetyltransferase|nr:GNAT family N-acetyltransferase [Mycobacteriales bacterium]
MSTAAERDGIRIERGDVRTAESREMVATYLAEINRAFGHDPDHAPPVPDEDFDPPTGMFLIVRDERDVAVGCGSIRLLDADTAEIKRMWINPSMRGRGAGWALLQALEAAAVDLGATVGVLDTNATLTSALALYRANGWQEVPAYNDNEQATHWFRKELA